MRNSKILTAIALLAAHLDWNKLMRLLHGETAADGVSVKTLSPRRDAHKRVGRADRCPRCAVSVNSEAAVKERLCHLV